MWILSDFYLKGSSSHSCYLNKSDVIFGNASPHSSTIKSHNVFIMTLRADLKIITNVKLNVPNNLIIMMED